MRTLLPAVLAVLIAGPAASQTPSPSSTAPIVLRMAIDDDAITPVTADFVRRAILEAERAAPQALILELDTPGGLMASTQQIVKDILSSPVPIIVYVAPRGARAASAGVFITLSAHIAAMAPGTHIGAAHPVSIGGVPGGPNEPARQDTASAPSVMDQKVLNDAVAWIRSIAELRGRNAEWAEKAVTESRSVTASEAASLNVVDLLATDVADLLNQVDGDSVTTEGGLRVLETAGAEVRTIEMWWGERLLSVISSPNIAFLLLVLGFYGLLFEFYTPGWGVAGTLGAICILLGFFGLAFLPVNYAGLGLLLLGLGLFVAEAFVHSFGALTLGGLTCVILGGLMLIDSPGGLLRVSAMVVVPVACATALIAFFLVGSVVKAHRARVQTGTETLAGTEASATRAFEPDEDVFRGTVWVHGELWQATAREPVEEGDQVRVEGRDGLTLLVKPAERVST